MKEREVFSINEFARLARTTHATLLHYDKIGLVEPVSRGDNNYRYYSGPQLGAVNLIRTCQEMGMSLKEVLEYRNARSPEGGSALLRRQIGKIEEAISEWRQTQKLLGTIDAAIGSVRGVDESAITVRELPEEHIVLGQPNDYSGGRNANDALLGFYRDCQRRHPEMNLNYPVWGVYSSARIKKRDWKWPDRYYFYNPEGRDAKPGGLYAVGYARGGYGDSDAIYQRMLAYIDGNGYEICGDAYEEYPLNEITVGDPHNYLMRVSVMVRERAGAS